VAAVEPEEETPGFGITINPLAMIFTVFNIEFEKRVAPAVSVFFGPELVLSGNVTAFGATAGARFFMIGEAIEGFWIAPEVGLYYASSGSASAVGYSAGGLLGYTFVWGHFVLSIGGGARYIDITAGSGGSTVSAAGVAPALRLSIGAAF